MLTVNKPLIYNDACTDTRTDRLKAECLQWLNASRDITSQKVYEGSLVDNK